MDRFTALPGARVPQRGQEPQHRGDERGQDADGAARSCGRGEPRAHPRPDGEPGQGLGGGEMLVSTQSCHWPEDGTIPGQG